MVVGFEAFSGVTAFGGLFLGPQDNSFATVNTATVAVEYTCRAPIEGTGGANRLEGGNSAEAILGLGGDDTIRADGGNDRIYGDAGHDNLAGGDGNDRLTGGAGADTFVFTPGGGRDVVADFGEGDGSTCRGSTWGCRTWSSRARARTPPCAWAAAPWRS